MLDVLMYALLGVVALVAVLLAYAATRPDTFSISRSVQIAAPAERIYPHVANLRAMNAWNPFVDPDPAIDITYSGPDAGPGARHVWRGNRNVGEGSIEVTEAVPPSRVAMRLRMLKPMKADNAVEFTLRPAPGGTTVTWAMSGPQSLPGKVVDILVGCDKMVGGQFEKGLARLKAISEKSA